MRPPIALLQCLALCLGPIVTVGMVNRTKSLWGGRRGPPILQLAYDAARLLRKRAVYSTASTAIFRITPWLALGTAVASGFVAPFLGWPAPAGFPLDFVWFAYLWGLGRVALMLGALDTGSSFEGMGASREATFSALVEPALFLAVGADCMVTHGRSFDALLQLRATEGVGVVIWTGTILALFILVQVESARIPVDDPSTHLELTMVHEVMILDHSGPELAALQIASAIKLTVGLGLVASLLNPLVGRASALATMGANLAILLALAVAVGTAESLVARLRLRAVPQYIVAALLAASIALLATTWGTGS